MTDAFITLTRVDPGTQPAREVVLRGQDIAVIFPRGADDRFTRIGFLGTEQEISVAETPAEIMARAGVGFVGLTQFVRSAWAYKGLYQVNPAAVRYLGQVNPASVYASDPAHCELRLAGREFPLMIAGDRALVAEILNGRQSGEVLYPKSQEKRKDYYTRPRPRRPDFS